MQFEKVSFEEVKKSIEQIMEYESAIGFDLTPSDIFRLYEETGVILDSYELNDWSGFEKGEKSISPASLLKQIGLDLESDELIYIVTDPCFNTKMAFAVKSNAFNEFAENTYPEYCYEDLVQPADMLFIQPNAKKIFAVHHEGSFMVN